MYGCGCGILPLLLPWLLDCFLFFLSFYLSIHANASSIRIVLCCIVVSCNVIQSSSKDDSLARHAPRSVLSAQCSARAKAHFPLPPSSPQKKNTLTRRVHARLAGGQPSLRTQTKKKETWKPGRYLATAVDEDEKEIKSRMEKKNAVDVPKKRGISEDQASMQNVQEEKDWWFAVTTAEVKRGRRRRKCMVVKSAVGEDRCAHTGESSLDFSRLGDGRRSMVCRMGLLSRGWDSPYAQLVAAFTRVAQKGSMCWTQRAAARYRA